MSLVSLLDKTLKVYKTQKFRTSLLVQNKLCKARYRYRERMQMKTSEQESQSNTAYPFSVGVLYTSIEYNLQEVTEHFWTLSLDIICSGLFSEERPNRFGSIYSLASVGFIFTGPAHVQTESLSMVSSSLLYNLAVLIFTEV